MAKRVVLGANFYLCVFCMSVLSKKGHLKVRSNRLSSSIPGLSCFRTTALHQLNTKPEPGIGVSDRERGRTGILKMISCITLHTFKDYLTAPSTELFRANLQASYLWVRSDISIYKRRWRPLSVHYRYHPAH